MISQFKGKIRLFIHKTEEKEFEEFSYDLFEDYLISDVEENQCANIIEEEINNMGIDSLLENSLLEILEKYEIDDTIEILGDITFECRGSNGYYDDDDFECEAWLENTKHRKLTPEQVKRFCDNEDFEKEGLTNDNQ